MNDDFFTWRDLQSPTPFNPSPMRTADFWCYHCHRITRVPVHTIESREASMWRERYETLMSSLNTALSECRVLHGDDPMRIFMEQRLLKIREEMNNRVERPKKCPPA